jgi:hypothetical protein
METPLADREALAKIIDPDAFGYGENASAIPKDKNLRNGEREALAKADAILALLRSQDGDAGIDKERDEKRDIRVHCIGLLVQKATGCGNKQALKAAYDCFDYWTSLSPAPAPRVPEDVVERACEYLAPLVTTDGITLEWPGDYTEANRKYIRKIVDRLASLLRVPEAAEGWQLVPKNPENATAAAPTPGKMK